MPSNMVYPKPRVNQHKITNLHANLATKICKSLIIPLLILITIYIISPNHQPCCRLSFFSPTKLRPKFDPYANNYSPTNITHLVFGITASSNTWKDRKSYIGSWWKPNKTRGYLFLDRPPTEYLPWHSKTDPPYRVSEDVSKYQKYNKHSMPYVIRMARAIAETFRAEKENVRWYVMADDDTVLFVDNLVDALSKYDHREFYYVGANSESVVNNVDGSFEMGFGGAGFALSYPLVEALVKNLDVCIERYPYLYSADHILQSCLADMGVPLTHEKGFHQIDLRGDISGLLSSHPATPLLSVHHLDAVHPIFPDLSRHAAVSHLMTAATPGQSRLLQQSVCHHKPRNWTLSLSWGYSVHIYESLVHPSVLHRPLKTFVPWKKGAWPPYLISTRRVPEDPCDAPHVMFFESVAEEEKGNVVTWFKRTGQRDSGNCSVSGEGDNGYSSADHIQRVRVISPVRKLDWVGSRRECCDILQVSDEDATIIVKVRTCKKNEIVG